MNLYRQAMLHTKDGSGRYEKGRGRKKWTKQTRTFLKRELARLIGKE